MIDFGSQERFAFTRTVKSPTFQIFVIKSLRIYIY